VTQPDDVSLTPATDQWPVLERLWQLYRHDLSEFRGSMPDDAGLFTLGHLTWYAGDDSDHCCYLVRRGDVLAGFVLLRGLVTEPRTMGEFFIVRAARRGGVGHAAAVEAIRRHPGRWEIAFQEENPKAARFWRRVATDVVGDAWTTESRPVPGKPHIPPDTWLFLRT
jgi:predicted acetyltransferase